jgi:hypothetical protein
MLYTVLLFIIILLAVAIYAENIKKSEHFSGNNEENCYGKVSSKMYDGTNGYYSNFMLNTYSNFDTAFRYLKNKSINALNSLNQYNVDLEQAYDIDKIARESLAKTSENVTTTHNTLRNLVNNKIAQYDNELASSNEKLESIKKTAKQQSNIKKEEVMERVNSVVTDVTKSEYDKFEKNTINSIEFKKPFVEIINNKIGQDSDVHAYNWQCEPGIIGAPIRVNSNDGSIQCLSSNGTNCDVNFCKDNDVRDIDHANFKTVTCTDKEASTPGHWCNNSARTLYNKQTTDYKNCPKDWKSVNRQYGVCMAPAKYNGNATHNPRSEDIAPECKGNTCQVFLNEGEDFRMQWSKSTNTLFPPKVNVVQRARDMTNVLGQVDSILRSTMGTGSPPSRIDNYKVYKNGVIVRAYKLREKGSGELYNKGKQLFDHIISSNINFRAGSGTFMAIRPPYSDPNVNIDTNNIYVVFTGFIKIPKGVSMIKFRTISDDGIRLMTRKPGEKKWNITINDWSRHTDKLTESASVQVEPEGHLEYQIEFFEYGGSATCVLQWSVRNDSNFEVVPREALFIDSDQCSKSVNVAKENTWKCLNNLTTDGRSTPIRMNDRGDIECISTNARDCVWGNDLNTCNNTIERLGDSSKLDPLVCGDMHQSLYGSSGYDNVGHWCSKARVELDPSNQQNLTEDQYGGRCGDQVVPGKKVRCLPGRCCNKYGYCGDGKFCSGDSTNRAYNG